MTVSSTARRPSVLLLLAAGSGERLGGSTMKQFLQLRFGNMIIQCLKAFSQFPEIEKVYLVIPESEVEKTLLSLETEGFSNRVVVVVGGVTRADSVRLGLKEIRSEYAGFDGFTIIHDVARFQISNKFILSMLDADAPATLTYRRISDSTLLLGDDFPGNKVRAPETTLAMQTPIKIDMEVFEQVLYANSLELRDGISNFIVSRPIECRMLETDGSTEKATYPQDFYRMGFSIDG